MPSEQIRAYIYRILMAGGGIAMFYGILSNEELTVWLGFAAVALNVLPATNTSTKRDE
jgi:hypothetical protein